MGNLWLPGLGSEHCSPGTCHLLTSLIDSPGGGSQACPDTTEDTLLVARPGAAKRAPRVGLFSVPSALIGRDAALHPAWCGRVFVEQQLTSSHPACHRLGSHVEKRKSGQVPGASQESPSRAPLSAESSTRLPLAHVGMGVSSS